MDDEELRRRYRTGESVTRLAEAGGVNPSIIKDRLQQMGEPLRRRGLLDVNTLSRDAIDSALSANWSIATAAKSLQVGRAALAARAAELGCLDPKESPAELLAFVDRIQAAIDDLRDLWWRHHSLSFGGRALGNDPPAASIAGLVLAMEEWQERLRVAARDRQRQLRGSARAASGSAKNEIRGHQPHR